MIGKVNDSVARGRGWGSGPQVSEANWCYRRQAWSLSLCDGSGWTGDRIWLATGCKLDARHDPLLSGVRKEYPIQARPGRGRRDGWRGGERLNDEFIEKDD